MANTKSRSLGPQLTNGEMIGGFLYLPFYVVLLALGLEYLNQLFGLKLTGLQINIGFFVINCVMTWIIFHKFLLRSFRTCRFWDLVQAVILGFVMYYVGNFLFSLIVTWLELDITSFNDETIQLLAQENMTVMVICSVLLAPIVEETLVRGLLFGTIHRQNRILAYAVTTVFFAAIHVWQYLFVFDPKEVLLAALQYIPAGIALGWTYEKANSIWAPIALHMIINAISFGILNLLQM